MALISFKGDASFKEFGSVIFASGGCGADFTQTSLWQRRVLIGGYFRQPFGRKLFAGLCGVWTRRSAAKLRFWIVKVLPRVWCFLVALGITDSPETFAADTMRGGAKRPDLVRMLTGESAPSCRHCHACHSLLHGRLEDEPGRRDPHTQRQGHRRFVRCGRGYGWCPW